MGEDARRRGRQGGAQGRDPNREEGRDPQGHAQAVRGLGRRRAGPHQRSRTDVPEGDRQGQPAEEA